MDWAQVQATIVSLLVAAIAWLVNRFVGAKMNDETRKAATWALEQAVVYIAQKYRNAPATPGDVKQAEAIQLATSVAPKAMAKLSDTQKVVLVDSTYARMKASLPHASTYQVYPEDPPS